MKSEGEQNQGVKADSMEEIKFSNIRIWLPKGDAKAIAIARKLLDLYEEGFKSFPAEEIDEFEPTS